MPNPSDPRHVYVGSVENPDVPGTTFDVYQLYDGAPGQNRVLEWKVNANDLSGNLIPGTLRDLGPPSSASVAQAPAPVTPPAPVTVPAPTPATPPPAPVVTPPPPAPASSGSFNAPVSQGTGTGTASGVVGGPVKGDPAHVYVGRNATGDAWQLIDAGGNVIEWYVPAGGDSRGPIIPGTTRNLGVPSNMTVAGNPATNSTPSTSPGASGTYNAPPPPTVVSNVQVGPISDPRHVYVSRDQNGDRWRVVDEGGKVVEWYTLPGAASGNVIPGSQRYTGATGTFTGTATTSTTPPTGAPATPAPAGAAAPGISLAVVAGVVLQLLNR